MPRVGVSGKLVIRPSRVSIRAPAAAYSTLTRDASTRASLALIRRASKPDGELAGGRLGAVGAVHEVLLHLEAPVATEVAADRAGRRRRRVGCTSERAE